MDLLFEKSVPGRGCTLLPENDVPDYDFAPAVLRAEAPKLPELSETDISRHYSALERRAHGVNNGFYPLGSCTMKYNPRVNEAVAALAGFTEVHPLQPDETVQGCLEALYLAEKYLGEITGMDAMTFQPAAGAHGELTGVMLIKKYHEAKDEGAQRTKIIVPDSAHGTNPATAVMCGMTVVNIASGPDGCVDLDALKAAVGPDTAGLMLTNPNTLGIFEKDICAITEIVHEAGGLVYYDGANLNAIMGVIRPGDMGFDCVHLNLHKTFSTPHGGGGPGSGAVGCKAFLAPYLPKPVVVEANGTLRRDGGRPGSIGKVKAFDGNFLVTLRALAYVLTLGRAGIPAAAKNAVLNANYMMHRLKERFTVVGSDVCMHEFVVTLEKEAKEKGVTAMDIAKALLDEGIHPPTMYFPLIVHEALMVEPTETEGKEGLDAAADTFIAVYDKAMADPAWAHAAPQTTPIGRPDEVGAARNPVLRYRFGQ
ncbi:aminomethyl-transferring glycine dehydrogenase subunit GcvPB [Ruminococcaceae bacterium OttesenSCG-928-A11]|nr:aminomethyl-transferring glycine dehydrogenase subunit GcvPB [Ruminococcaceae bacterium OttesenSCG-928-A11]